MMLIFVIVVRWIELNGRGWFIRVLGWHEFRNANPRGLFSNESYVYIILIAISWLNLIRLASFWLCSTLMLCRILKEFLGLQGLFNNALLFLECNIVYKCSSFSQFSGVNKSCLASQQNKTLHFSLCFCMPSTFLEKSREKYYVNMGWFGLAVLTVEFATVRNSTIFGH